MICSYAAIGFMSCLTSYQVVAAVATLGPLAFLNYVEEWDRKFLLFGTSRIGCQFRTFRRVNQRFDQR
ncbi:MAG: hypothetical protein ACLU4J_05425 [Butyricimonas paravirosa]